MDTIIKLPLYAKISLLLIGLYVFVTILSIAQDIIVPLIYATIVAILMSPVVDFLQAKGVNRAIAVSVVWLGAILITGGFVVLLLSQASIFYHAWPRLMDKLQDLLKQAVGCTSGILHIRTQKINSWITDVVSEFIKNRKSAIGVTLTSLGGIISAAILTPVYIFMILFYQPHLLHFTHRVFGIQNDTKVTEVLSETKTTVQKYMAGLFVEFVIISVLNSIGLVALGIEYSILLGVAGAVLNVIPVVGGIICVALFVIIALLTKTPVYVLYVVALYTVIQFIDNHYIFPKIVGSKVKLNVLISLVAVMMGDALWGIPGMFLAIPLVAIVKLIFDRIGALESWGYLLGTPTVNNEAGTGFTINRFLNYINIKFSKNEN